MKTPEQEPTYKVTVVDDQHPDGIPLKQWVGLTDEQEPIDFELAYGEIYKDQRAALAEALAQPSDSVEQEPLEYWNAVEGWVKIDEVRQHFETVSCGTIYKNAGEGRVPLYTTPPKREWVDLTDKEIDAALKSCNTTDTYKYFRAIEAKLKEKNHD